MPWGCPRHGSVSNHGVGVPMGSAHSRAGRWGLSTSSPLLPLQHMGAPHGGWPATPVLVQLVTLALAMLWLGPLPMGCSLLRKTQMVNIGKYIFF